MSAALFVAIFVLEVSAGSPDDSVSMLYALPITLIALDFGRRAGTAAGLAGVALLAGWAIATDVTMTPLEWASRVTPMLLLGTLIGDSSDRVRRAERTERRAAAVALLQRDGAETNDLIFQGLAATKWMLESGDVDGAAATLEDTMVTAQQRVTRVLGSKSVLRDLAHG